MNVVVRIILACGEHYIYKYMVNTAAHYITCKCNYVNRLYVSMTRQQQLTKGAARGRPEMSSTLAIFKPTTYKYLPLNQTSTLTKPTYLSQLPRAASWNCSLNRSNTFLILPAQGITFVSGITSVSV